MDGLLEGRVTGLREKSEEAFGKVDGTARQLEERCPGTTGLRGVTTVPIRRLSKQWKQAYLLVGASSPY